MDISTAVASERPVELRAAVRFPLCVPITICTDAGDLPAVTENISANGVLFELATSLVVGSICVRRWIRRAFQRRSKRGSESISWEVS